LIDWSIVHTHAHRPPPLVADVDGDGFKGLKKSAIFKFTVLLKFDHRNLQSIDCQHSRHSFYQLLLLLYLIEEHLNDHGLAFTCLGLDFVIVTREPKVKILNTRDPIVFMEDEDEIQVFPSKVSH
jgi:hypothetical protein